jgi:hypothetical protein
MTSPRGGREAAHSEAKAKSVNIPSVPRSSAGTEDSSEKSSLATVPESVLVSIRDALIDVMGPMGKIVLSEQVKCLGASMDRYPRDRILNLIDSVSQEIFDESMRNRFRRGMSDGVRTLQ